MVCRKMLRSRKAFIFNILLVVLTIIVLTNAYIKLSAKKETKYEIGEQPLELVIKMQEGEKAMIFLDFAAKMAIYQAIYDMQAAGGITESSVCGSYYGFNRWNSESGDICFVDPKTAKDSLRDFFVSNLVARVGAYPRADFVGNLPTAAFARGEMMAATQQMGVSAPSTAAAAAPSCGESFMKDFTYTSDKGFFPPEGARIWVPSQATCPGFYPLVVFLHGCMRQTHASVHKDFGDSSATDIIPLVKNLIEQGKVQPVILVAPSQTKGEGIVDGVDDSPCGPTLWGRDFDFNAFVDIAKSNLPQGVQVSSISFVGHGEAGCSPDAGTHRAALEYPGFFAIGQFDSCTSQALGESLSNKVSASNFLAVHSSQATDLAAQDAAMGISSETQCPDSGVEGGGLEKCLSDASGSRFSFVMSDRSTGAHGKALLAGMEQFLLHFFAASQPDNPEADEPILDTQQVDEFQEASAAPGESNIITEIDAAMAGDAGTP